MNFYETLCSSGIPLMNLIYDLMALELFNKGMWHIKGTMFWSVNTVAWRGLWKIKETSNAWHWQKSA